MPRQDDLLGIAQQHAVREALYRVQEDAAQSKESYNESLRTGDTAGASMELRRMADLTLQGERLGLLLGHEQQQGQQQGQQQQFTEAERAWLERNPSVASDPRKMAEVIGAANALITRGYDRNSMQYLAAIDTAMGKRDNSVESELTPDEVVSISKSKYGAVTPDEYNQCVDALAEMKTLGLVK